MSLCGRKRTQAAPVQKSRSVFNAFAVHAENPVGKIGDFLQGIATGPRDAARGRRRRASPFPPGSSTPLRPRAPAPACRTDRPRPAAPEPARGCRRAPRWYRMFRSPDRATRRSSRGTPRPHPHDGARVSRADRWSRRSRQFSGSPRCCFASMKKCGAIRTSPRTRWSCTLPAYHAAMVAPSLWPSRMPRRNPIASSSCGSTSVASRCM